MGTKTMIIKKLFQLLFFLNLCIFTNAFALENKQEINVAVAANFTPTLNKIIAQFEEKNPTLHINVISSSSGSIYRQIVQGAPYNIFLSADQQYVQKLIEQNLVSKENRFSYAEGILALCSRIEKLDINDSQIAALLKKADHIAIADPSFAPYGVAAKEFLKHIPIFNDVQSKLVFAKDVSQVMNYLDTTAASFGFVPLSLAKSSTTRACSNTNIWIVPKESYSPIIQDAALIKNSESNQVVKLFFNYLKSSDAQKIITQSNYKRPQT